MFQNEKKKKQANIRESFFEYFIILFSLMPPRQFYIKYSCFKEEKKKQKVKNVNCLYF